MEKLRKLQEAMLEGGKRAGDKDLKERRLKKKKAAEKRLKVRKHNCLKITILQLYKIGSRK